MDDLERLLAEAVREPAAAAPPRSVLDRRVRHRRNRRRLGLVGTFVGLLAATVGGVLAVTGGGDDGDRIDVVSPPVVGADADPGPSTTAPTGGPPVVTGRLTITQRFTVPPAGLGALDVVDLATGELVVDSVPGGALSLGLAGAFDPIDLTPGRYTVAVAPPPGQQGEPAASACSTDVVLAPGEVLELEAAWAPDGLCAFQEALDHRVLLERAAGGDDSTAFAETRAAYEELWNRLGSDGEPPSVDFGEEVVVYFGVAGSGNCPLERLSGVLVDRSSDRMYAAFDFGGTNACTVDDGPNPPAVMVAVARTELPVAPFSIWTDPSDPRDCCPDGVTEVESVSDDGSPGLVAGPGAFDQLGPGWHDLDTGPVPPSTSSIAWTGSELLVATTDRLFAYAPSTATWRELPPPPFAGEATPAIAWMDGAVLWIDDGYGSEPASASLDLSTEVWVEQGPVPNGYEEMFRDLGVTSGPRDPNLRLSLVWTGERLVDATHGAVFDPATGEWTVLRMPDDPYAYSHLLYANPVWDGHSFVMAYPHDVPGLVYDAEASGFREVEGIDSALVETPGFIGDGLSVRLGDKAFFVRGPAGYAATFDSAADAWEILPPVPDTGGGTGCPSHAASLGDSVVVAPCYGEPPVHLVGDTWVPIDGYDPVTACCIGLWLGVDGALVVWDSDTDTINNPAAPYVSARIWVPPDGG